MSSQSALVLLTEPPRSGTRISVPSIFPNPPTGVASLSATRSRPSQRRPSKPLNFRTRSENERSHFVLIKASVVTRALERQNQTQTEMGPVFYSRLWVLLFCLEKHLKLRLSDGGISNLQMQTFVYVNISCSIAVFN